MIAATLQGLLANLGIIAILIGAWALTFRWTAGLGQHGRAALMILGGSLCTIMLMALPFQVAPGLFFDLRATPIGLAGFFGGPLVGGAVGIVAALYRLQAGGVGAAPAIIGIGAVMLTGIAAHLLVRGRRPTTRQIVFLSLAVAPASVSGFFFLPPELRSSLLVSVGLPSIVINLVTILLVGVVALRQLQHLRTAAENRLYRSLMDAFPEPLNAKDLDGRFTAANPATAELMRAHAAADLIGKTDFDFYPAEIARSYREDEEAVLRAGQRAILEQPVDHGDGAKRWMATFKVPLLDSRGAVQGLLTHNRDISELKRLRDEREAAVRRLDDALAHMADALAVFDSEARLVLCNEQYRALFPLTAAVRVPGTPLSDILHAAIATGEQAGVAPEEVENWVARTTAALTADGENHIDLADGRTLYARIRRASEGTALVVITDITAQRIAERELATMNRKLLDLARVDALTGVANRGTFDDTLATEQQRSERTGAPLSLILLDLDAFKSYNDTHGHLAGDDCLRRVAEEMRRAVTRAGDLVARYGGEEFAIILSDTDEAGAIAVADRLRERIRALAIPHPGSPHRVVTISVGVASAGGDRAALARLVHRADVALYEAKGAGRDTVCRYFPEMERIVVPASPVAC